ncbi:aromatic amino acid DMT transporter YddG, partial [Neisseria sp. P0003.S003]
TLTATTKAQGNAVGFFFLLVSCILWAKYFAGGYGSLHFDTGAILYAVAAAACMGLGYAVWNIGISCGNMTVLAGASYFIPIFSALIS